MSDIPEDQLRGLRSLNDQGVQYLVIGGYAMRHYGSGRETFDVDLLVNNSRRNAGVLFDVLTTFLGHQPAFTREDLEKPNKKVTPHWTDYAYLDILTSVDGLDFTNAFRRREQAITGGLVIPVISLLDLLFIKKRASLDPKRHEKEEADIAFIEQRLSNQSSVGPIRSSSSPSSPSWSPSTELET